MNKEKEPGFTMIKNELLDEILRQDFSKTELKVLLAIARQTWGWQKEVDDISLSRLSEMTGISKANLSRAVNSLSEKGVISKKNGEYGQSLQVNKCAKEWVSDSGVVKTTTPGGLLKQQRGGCQNNNSGVVVLTTTKETIKTNYQKKKKKVKKKEISLVDFLKEMSEKGEKGIQPNDKIFDYGRAVGVSDEMLMTAWHKFKDFYIGKVDKKQKDWRAVFRNCVKDNWYAYWGIPDHDDEPAYWTSKGKQKRREVKKFNHGFE